MARVIVFLIFFFQLSLTYGGDFKPSFDCKKASNATETTICSDSYLSIQDKHNTQLYNKLLARDIENLKQEQLKWIKERNLCRDDRKCIKSSYDKRFSDLNIKERITSYKENLQGEYRSSYWFWMGRGVYYTPPRKPIDECDDFLKILNEEKKSTFYRCSVDIKNPFSKLNWEELSLDSNMDLVNQIFRLKTKNFYSEYNFQNFIKLGGFKVLQTTVSGYGEKNDGIYYQIQYECDPSDIQNLRTYEFGGNNFFHKNENGELSAVFGLGGPVELLSYKNRLFTYSFTQEIADENMKHLDKTLQVI